MLLEVWTTFQREVAGDNDLSQETGLQIAGALSSCDKPHSYTSSWVSTAYLYVHNRAKRATPAPRAPIFMPPSQSFISLEIFVLVSGTTQKSAGSRNSCFLFQSPELINHSPRESFSPTNHLNCIFSPPIIPKAKSKPSHVSPYSLTASNSPQTFSLFCSSLLASGILTFMSFVF